MATGGMTTIGDVQFDQTAYNLMADYALRPQMYFDQVASVMPTDQAHPGKSVTFPIVADLPLQSTSIDESTDVTPQVLSDTTVVVTLAEYGAAVKTSAFLRGTSYVTPFDPIVANVIGFNAGASLDVIARNVLKGGAQVIYGTGATARNNVVPTSTIASGNVRQATAFLRRNNANTIGGYYVGFMHPDVSYDYRDANDTGWFTPAAYSDAGRIWNGEVGIHNGVRWIEASRSPIFADAGSSTTNTDVYASIIVGGQALAKAYSYVDGNGPQPRVFPGPVTDTLRRFVPMGWYWLGGYALYRNSATTGYSTLRIETSSSIGNNAAAGTNDPAINAN